MAFDITTLDPAAAALAAYDWGSDPAPLTPLDQAAVAAFADPPLRAELERRLVAILGPGPSRAAKEYACRKLMLIGTAACVPALAALLGDRDHSHMARFALERIDLPEAGDALRAALGRLGGDLAIGMISSLAARGDAASVPALAKLLAGEPAVAVAAAEALGGIGTPEALAALDAAAPAAAGPVAAIVDAKLACAERLLAGGRRGEAQAIYRSLVDAARGRPEARLAELAATRGLLACLDQSTAAT